MTGTAGPSAPLRSGRDDTSIWVLRFATENSEGPKGALQIRPLRYAPVGMTKGRVALSVERLVDDRNNRSPPLRFGRDDNSFGM
jgi:hypothetical protein